MLTETLPVIVPDVLMRGVALILGPRGCAMFMSPVSYADLRAAPDARDDPADREEHLMWGFSARRERFMTDDPLAAAPTDLKALVDRIDRGLEPRNSGGRAPIRSATVSSFSVKTSTPVKPWKTRNVTLLGDALHNMPPYRGVGANTAMWDAALLRDAIVGRGSELPLIERLAQYEPANDQSRLPRSHNLACRNGALPLRSVVERTADEGVAAGGGSRPGSAVRR